MSPLRELLFALFQEQGVKEPEKLVDYVLNIECKSSYLRGVEDGKQYEIDRQIGYQSMINLSR